MLVVQTNKEKQENGDCPSQDGDTAMDRSGCDWERITEFLGRQLGFVFSPTWQLLGNLLYKQFLELFNCLILFYLPYMLQ